MLGSQYSKSIDPSYEALQKNWGIQERQQQMAEEQWDWQRKMYENAYASAQQAATQGAGSLSKLINQYNEAYNQAKAANEQRYQQGLDIIGQTTGQREADIRTDYAGRQADIMQQLARTGMANTTVAPTLGLGVEREQQSALNRLADELQGTKLGWIERKEDAYPESDIIVALAQAMGQGGANYNSMFQSLGNLASGPGVNVSYQTGVPAPPKE